MSNNNENQDSVVFETFDKATEYVTGLLDKTMKDANVPVWARAKVGVARHIDSGIKIYAAFDSGDDTNKIIRVRV